MTQEIETHLESLGWEPRSELRDNPGIETSFVRGWTKYTDRTLSPPREVRQWIGEWQNAAGDVIRYSLHYQDQNPAQLRVWIALRRDILDRRGLGAAR